MGLNLLLPIIWLHFLGDFVLQTDKMAKSKSSSNVWLTHHVLVYSLCLLPFGLKFAAVNMALHGVTDYVTSRVSSAYYKEGNRHMFFVTVGADQALHLTALVLTWSIPALRWW